MSTLRCTPGPHRLGKSDLSVGPLAFGCWRFAGTAPADARARLEGALELGMSLVDTADVYGLDDGLPFGAAEELLGRVLHEAPGLRTRMVLASKGGIVPGVPYDSSPARLRAACEASLRRLATDHIDLWQIHRPDLLAHPADVAATLTELRQAGKIREVGLSNVSTSQFETLQAQLPFPIATHQPELSPLVIAPFDDGLIDQCLRLGVTPLAWSPLAGGRLALEASEASARGDDRLAAVIGALDKIARAREVPRSVAALAFLLVHPAGIVPIVGTQRIERLRECAAATGIELERSEWYAVFAAARGEPLP